MTHRKYRAPKVANSESNEFKVMTEIYSKAEEN